MPDAINWVDSLPEQTRNRIYELVGRAQRGDETVLPALQAELDRLPELSKFSGDLYQVTKRAWIELFCSQNLYLRECIERQVHELEATVVQASDDRLLQLLGQRVVITWLQAHFADMIVSCFTTESPNERQLALGRQTAANNAHLLAIKTAATCRKTLRPALSPLDMANPVNEGSARAQAKRRDTGSAFRYGPTIKAPTTPDFEALLRQTESKPAKPASEQAADPLQHLAGCSHN